MQMPETELPRHLQQAEVEAILVQLAQDAGQMARALKLARVFSSGLAGMDAEDLLQKAIVLLLAGRRRWRRGLSTLIVLKGAMRSIASNTRKKADYILADDLDSPSDEDVEDESSHLAEGVTRESDPARVLEGESDLAGIQNAVKGDEEVELLVEALADGLTGMSIAAELGWDAKKYDAARKRLSRRLAMLKADRSER
jgi:DNA-directed RNA polymerase specialized sigma24 family protein